MPQSESERLRVVLDTNALWSDPRLRGRMRLLLDLSRRGHIALVVPEIVLLEFLKHFELRYEEAVDGVSSAVRKLTNLAGELKMPEIEPVRVAVVEHEATLRSLLHDHGAVVAVHPTASHAEVAERAVLRRKPFKPKGTGYQDTLVWLTALEEAQEGPVALISANTGDFAERSGEDWILAPDLRDDLESAGFDPSRVTLHPSIRDFIEDLKEHEEVGTEATESPTLDEFHNALEDSEVFDYLAQDLIAEIQAGGIERWPALHLVSGEPQAFSLTGRVSDIEPLEAYEFAEGERPLVLLRAWATVDADFHLGRTEAEWLPPDEKRLIDVWTEDLVSGHKSWWLVLEAEAVREPDGWFTLLELTDVREVDSDAEPE